MDDGFLALVSLPLLSLAFFCVCSLFFLREVSTPLGIGGRYNRSAMRVAKGYKIFAWGLMMGIFLLGLVMSFVEVYVRL